MYWIVRDINELVGLGLEFTHFYISLDSHRYLGVEHSTQAFGILMVPKTNVAIQ